MQNENETVLQRLRKFKSLVLSSDIPNALLLDLLENFITADDNIPFAESVPVLEGQLSLFDCATQFQN